MQITLEKQSSTLASLKVNLVEADYQQEVDNKIKEYSKKANIKGFRPGKVPAGVVRQMMGESIIVDEVFKKLSSSIQSYIRENDLRIVGEPLPSEEEMNKKIDWKNQKEFDFTYEVGLIPDFSYDLCALSADNYEVSISDEDIEKTIKKLQKDYADVSHPEISEEGHFVSGELSKDDQVLHTAMIAIEKVNADQKALFIGKKVGDEIVFDIKAVYGDNTEEIARLLKKPNEIAVDASGEYTLKVTEITHYTDAEINQSFFDKLFGEGTIDSKEGLVEKLSAYLSDNYNEDCKYIVNSNIRKALLESVSLDLSAEFLKRWIVQANKGKVDPAQLEENFSSYENEFKWSIIRNRIVEENSIKVEAEEIKAEAGRVVSKQFLGGMEIPEQMAEAFKGFVDRYLSENEGANYYNLFEQLLNTKVYDVLKEKISLNTKKVSPEELYKIASENQQ